MRTTLQIEDPLLRDAKARAAREGRTLTSVIEDALRQYLREKKTTGFKIHLRTSAARVLPGVDVADRDSLYDLMGES